MRQQLDRQTATALLQVGDIANLPFSELERLVRLEAGVNDFLPDGVYAVDPRNGDRIIYNSSRGRRPSDNRPTTDAPSKPETECKICQGETTGIVDIAGLSEGFTFINKNLFPALYPFDIDRTGHPRQEGDGAPQPAGQLAFGLHFLQWTSSFHDKDWHNMPLADAIVVMNRLAALEKKLVEGSNELAIEGQGPLGRSDRQGAVIIMKNYGHLTGGSIAHGHQQIAFSSVMPRRFLDDERFEAERGEPFSTYLLRVNPPQLIIKDYGPAVLLVPYFMRRPYDMMLVVKDASRRYLYQLNEPEITAVAEGWRDATRAIHAIMPAVGRETAYNVIANNGPGAGLYFEFLPYTQETGGFEQLGLLICQANTHDAAGHLQQILLNEGNPA
jgi:galactose-1-phosphate uridylyltransferase